MPEHLSTNVFPSCFLSTPIKTHRVRPNQKVSALPDSESSQLKISPRRWYSRRRPPRVVITTCGSAQIRGWRIDRNTPPPPRAPPLCWLLVSMSPCTVRSSTPHHTSQAEPRPPLTHCSIIWTSPEINFDVESLWASGSDILKGGGGGWLVSCVCRRNVFATCRDMKVSMSGAKCVCVCVCVCVSVRERESECA